MGKADELFGETEKLLDDMADAHRKRLEKAIRTLEQRVISLAAELPTRDGRLLAEMDQAQQFHQAIVREFEDIFGEAVSGDILPDYDQAQTRIQAEMKGLGIDLKFADTDKDALKALKTQAERGFMQFADEAQEALAEHLYDAVVGGGDFASMIDNFRAALTGLDSVGGRSMAAYAETIATDSLMGYFARVQQAAAQRAGLRDYLYFGNIIKSSRPFCIARAGGVYSEQTIRSWEGLRWKGKKPGNIMIVRGGYNCRHHFRAIDPKWVDDGILSQPQSYFDEDPGAFSEKLQEEVQREKGKI